MNGSAVYLGNKINEYKTIFVKDRKDKLTYRFNYNLEWNFMDHYELRDIAEDHNIPLSGLIRVILEDFLENRLKYQEIRDKLDEIY